MKLLKPDWIHYDDKPIFSVDVHPDGNKFATGGQGNDCGRVVVWNLVPVLSAEAELDKTIPKILCQLDNHLACVNCVRWSMNGAMLASGGDDKVLMIWKKGKGPTAVFGNSGITKMTESWRCISTLRGHSGDVLDVAWSPQDRWLASCSVDNNIIIWDMLNMPAMIAILKGHTGLVKGVTWDPVGKFLASQSDDRCVKIWKTSDWTCQSTITEPFEECGGTTHVLRLSWSPDGLYLVSAHAMNGGGPTAQIIEREGWKCDKDFVGHRKAVTCVRFHNSILKRQAPKTNKSQQYCCLAVGSRDRSLSIWMTALQRPLIVIHDLFQDTILDLSWSTDRNILLACSTDGTVACLQFTATELGTPLSEDDKNSLYQRMYGKSADIDMTAQSGKEMIIEYAELLNLKDKSNTNHITAEISMENNNPEIINHKSMNNSTSAVPSIPLSSSSSSSSGPSTQSVAQPLTPTAQPLPTSASSSSSPPPPPFSSMVPIISPMKSAIPKQIETRTVDGKRRITPVFIPLNQETSDSTPELNSSSRSTTNIIVEKAPPSKIPCLNSIATIAKENNTTTTIAAAAATTAVVIAAPVTEATATTTTTTKTPPPTPLSAIIPIDVAITSIIPKKIHPEKSQLDTRLTIKCPSKTKLDTTETQSMPQKSIESVNQTATTLAASAATASVTAIASAASSTTSSTSSAQPPSKFNTLTAGKAVPLQGNFARQNHEYRIQVTNSFVNTTYGPLTKLICSQVMPPNKQLWHIVIGSPVTLFCLCANYVLASSIDGTLRFVNIRTGELVLPVIKIPSAAVQCAFNQIGDLGGIVSECGKVRIWNIGKKKMFISTECCDILSGNSGSGGITVAQFCINDNGIIFIVLTNGCSYSYDLQLDSWIVLDSKDPVVRYSMLKTPPIMNPTRNMSTQPLCSIQRISQNYQQSARNYTETFHSAASSEWQHAARLFFIENQIKICEAIQSTRELRQWYSALGAHLACHGTEQRVRILLDDLLGPIHLNEIMEQPSTKRHCRLILNINTHDLMEEVLNHLKNESRWQRLYMEYSEQLETCRNGVIHENNNDNDEDEKML